MVDANTRIKNRIHATHDLQTLWRKLRKEGYSVYEADDYIDNVQKPYHLYIIEGKNNAPVEVLYRDKTNQELAEDKELGLTPFLQEIEWIRY